MKTALKDFVFILLTFISFIFLMSLLKNCYIINKFSYGYVCMLFLIGTAFFLLYSHIISKLRYKILFLLCIAALIGILIFIYPYKISILISLLKKNWNTLNSYISEGRETDFSQFKLLFLILVPVCTAVLLKTVTSGFYNIILFILLGVMIVFWYTGFEASVKSYIFIYCLITLITYSINSYIKTWESITQKGIKILNSGGQMLVHLILWSIAAAVLISIIPQNINGRADRIKERIEKRYTESSKKTNDNVPLPYGIVSSGYDDSSKKLGGPISINDTEVMKVKSDRPMYLKGTVKTQYDGFTWKNQNEKFIDRVSGELLPSQSGGYIYKFNKFSEITIYPDNIRTSTIFVPQYVFDILTDKPVQYNKDGVFRSKNKMTMDYSIYCYGDETSGIFASSPSHQAPLIDAEYDFCLKQNPDCLTKYEEYLKLPDNISPRVYALAAQITSGCTKRGEKVEKIYNYLKNNYPYSIHVSSVPKDQEFVDYFLFTEKKGYCTYFATAAAILCRIAGVPSRYAEGFNIPDKKNAKGLYVVSNRSAHAWCEVLISPETNTWGILDCIPNSQAELAKQLDEKQNASESEDINSKVFKKSNNKNNEEDINAQNLKNKKAVNAFEMAVIFIMCTAVLYLAGTFIIDITRKHHIVKNESVVPLYLYYLKRCKALGYNKTENVGDMEFAHRMHDGEIKDRFKSLVKDVYAECYGNKKDSHIDKNEYYRFIGEYMKKQKHKLG